MINKIYALNYIKSLAEQKVVSKEELCNAYDSGISSVGDISMTKKMGISDILYFIGGGIVFLGITILLAQNWSTLSFTTKLLSTFGAGIASYVLGVVLSQDERAVTAGSAFYLISALVIPMGIYIVFDYAGFDASSYGSQSLIALISLAMYFASYFLQPKNLFVFFCIIFGTWLFYSFTSFLIGNSLDFDSWKFYEYRTLVVGLSYMLIGYSFSKDERSSLSNFLYSFGVLGFLGTSLSLGGWKPDQNIFWELVYPGFVFGALFLSVYIKSKSFLTFGTIFLMIYILKITSEYFSTGLGWPLALVIAGLLMMLVGYMSISLKNRYLSST